ncbi:hypothetical protein [Butyricimonas faecihominis]|uniref:hypothetical protein n=1 Tax=Butyricimonas faecihominis TaxID=1472416 RepID=UPI0026DBFEAC|nr:hypothetical protein [Butyricimonas faecihominis]
MENLHVKVENGVKAIVIREGKALELKEPRIINISGVLDSPLKWLEKRINTIDMLKSNIIVDRDKMTITLTIEETEHYNKTITGKLELHPDFLKFGINSGQYRTAIEMSEFIKMNRAHFDNRQAALDLTAKLKNFKAKINKSVEEEYNLNKGDKRLLTNQAVESNIPESFKVNLPIFKGTPKKELEVETYFNPDDLTCTLVSPQANEDVEAIKDSAIDDVLKSIRDIAPDIVIIER